MIAAMFDPTPALAAHQRLPAGQHYRLLSQHDADEVTPEQRRPHRPERAVRIVEVLERARVSMTVAEIAQAAGMSPKHARKIVEMLVEEGVAECTGERRVGRKNTAARCFAMVGEGER